MLLMALTLMMLTARAIAGAQVARPEVAAETIATIAVQGNVLTPQDEIVRIAAVQVGMSFRPETLSDVSTRLEADGRFVSVQVLKRFASISDPSRVALVIIVDEGPVSITRTGNPEAPVRVARDRRLRLLFLPIVQWDEGYGVSYGARITRPDPLGPRSRLSFPLTWGAERRAGVQLERVRNVGVVRVVEGSGVLTRRRHPFYRVSDIRQRLAFGGNTKTSRGLRGDFGGGWEHVSFGERADRLIRLGAGVTYDTRVDPLLARNAVYARAAIEHLWSRDHGAIATSTVDARGYLGLYRQSVVVVRAVYDGANRARPLYEKRMIGGAEVLRGFRFGRSVGDTLSGGSVELRSPLTSPLGFGKLGASAFLDVAAVYDEGERIRKQKFERGIGGSVWLSAPLFRINVSVARGLGRGVRAHLGTTVMF